MTQAFVYISGFFAIVSILGIDLTSVTVGIGAFSIAISFTMSTLIQNLVLSILVIGDRAFVPGDEIMIQGITGRVVNIGIRTTVIEQEGRHRVFIPNSVFIASPVVKRAYKDDSQPQIDPDRS